MKARRAVYGCLCLAVLAAPVLAPATVEEQRARLPPPAQCEDPIEGIWMSHKYEAFQGLWYVFTLRIRRGERGALAGDIEAHVWSGTERDAQPPACEPGLNHWTVRMDAIGTSEGMRVEFGGTRWRPEQRFCGTMPGPGEYNLDHFSGVIDPGIQEFQSVNNDGGQMVNDPTVFRRVRCFDPPPHPFVAPPAFHPPRRRSCGR